MKFQIGDEVVVVKILPKSSQGKAKVGDKYRISDAKIYNQEYPYSLLGVPQLFAEEELELSNYNLTQNTMSTLNAFTRRTFSESQHKLFNAGLIDASGIPTQQGKDELSALLWEKNLKELEKVAEDMTAKK